MTEEHQQERDAVEAARLLGKTRELFVRVAKERPQVPEGTGALSLAAFAAPKVQELLVEACETLDALDRHYGADRSMSETDTEVAEPEDLTDIGAMISVEVAAQEIADLAYLTHNNTTACAEELKNAIARDEVLLIATLCDTGLRRLRRGMVALEYAVCEFEGWEAPARSRLDLAASLKVRRLFWEVRRIILTDAEPADQDLSRHLSNMSVVLEVISAHTIYPLARIDDRVYIKKLGRRIESWLASAQRDAGEGRRIWQDASTFAHLLTGVNNRQEIREHDQEVVDYGCRILKKSEATTTRLPDRLHRQLETLLGLDSELDTMILKPESYTLENWKSCLAARRTQLASLDAEQGPGFHAERITGHDLATNSGAQPISIDDPSTRR